MDFGDALSDLSALCVELYFGRGSAEEFEEEGEGKSVGGKSVYFAGPDESGSGVLVVVATTKKYALCKRLREQHFLLVLR